MKRLDGNIPYNEGPQVSSYAHPAPVDYYVIFYIYTLCPARFVLRIFPVRIVLQRYGTIWY